MHYAVLALVQSREELTGQGGGGGKDGGNGVLENGCVSQKRGLQLVV